MQGSAFLTIPGEDDNAQYHPMPREYLTQQNGNKGDDRNESLAKTKYNVQMTDHIQDKLVCVSFLARMR